MLTRIEISGFKTFEDFALDLGSFTAILGANASGKSNLFDALRLLSNLASLDLRRAFRNLRGEVAELFRRQPDPAESMHFAIEVLVEPEVRDVWGQDIELTHTRMRYELEIARQRDDYGLEQLVVVREEAKPIHKKNDRWARRLDASSEFSRHNLRYSRRGPWLTTEADDPSGPKFTIRQDRRRGQRPVSARSAGQTVLSTVSSIVFPHLYALAEELRSWRFLQLDPAALRNPSPAVGVAEELEPDGANLAYVLARIQAETASRQRPKGRLAEIAAALASVVPGIIDVEVEGDQLAQARVGRAGEVREAGFDRLYRIDISMRDSVPFSSRVLSDGTLRALALLTMLHDPRHRGLLLFEEPENGIHPARLRSLLSQLRCLVTDPTLPEAVNGEPLSQVIMNSHSPVVLSALIEKAEGVRPRVVFADIVTRVDPGKGVSFPTTRMRPVIRQGREILPTEESEGVDQFEVDQFLATVNPPGA